MHSVYHNYLPITFQDYFQFIDHNQATRSRTNICYYLPLPRTEKGKKSLKYSGVQNWSRIPESLRHLTCTAFKYQTKLMILNKTIRVTIP